MTLLRMKPRNMLGDTRKQFVAPGSQPSGRNSGRSSNPDDYESGGMVIKNLPFLSFLNPQRDLECLFKPFKTPCENLRTQESDRLLKVKTLGSRRRWGNMPMTMAKILPPVDVVMDCIVEEPTKDNPPEEPKKNDEPEPEPLILWTGEVDGKDVEMVVPPLIGKFLRPHQREGVQFMFDCVSGVRGFAGNGCILADDMGLGKTLQSICIMYTLLCTSMENPDLPTINRAIVVCPTSLVKNWDDEIIKWLKGKVKTIALFESGRENVVSGIMSFINGSKWTNKNMAAKVLIISYETFRMHAEKFAQEPQACELLICDEAHRLKNSQSQINQALAALPCKRRILLSGTPMQNDLEEFYAMVDFTNPNILGDPREFRKRFLGPILVGREPDCTDHDRKLAQRCSGEMCEIVNQFILRRTNSLNAKFLPPKLTQVVCCNLSYVQRQMYSHFLHSNAYRNMMKKNSSHILSSITALKKLCNHPSLIFEQNSSGNTKIAPGFEECIQYLPEQGQRHRSCHPEWSGKFQVLDRLMQVMRRKTTDRIVIVSNYTQTLDVVSTLCRERNFPSVRLDGSTSANKRKKLVDVFNDPKSNSFAFLLSSKAGGCGLNLIGANRLVLFDPDWNPATDKQAAARIWREGQKKQCFIYRFVATGTLEEKIFQRQLSKEGLQSIVDDKEEVNSLSTKDLKRLFVFMEETPSDTHDQLKCSRCNLNEGDCDHSMAVQPQIGMPAEEDLNNWSHHYSYATVEDEVMQEAQAGQSLVSFVFSCRVDWDLFQVREEKERQDQLAIDKEKLLRVAEKINDNESSDVELLESETDEFDADLQPPKKRKRASTSPRKSRAVPPKRAKLTIDSSEDEASDNIGETESEDDFPMPQSRSKRLKADTLSESEEEVVFERSTVQRDIDVLSESDEEGIVDDGPRMEDAAASILELHSMGNYATPEEETKEEVIWACGRCTLHNPMEVDSCEGCGFPQPRKAKKVSPSVYIE
ncbi:Aste57867_12445 [Aphanomyces stellatus]|uniref:Aste57867_12445 protein n=1 Tax=Aphanomyces stellatus TaxID=120398 RepID=A0A485KVK0_9STRA|nr:hypothetical protein As57867_012399 [Aphanomyces stellatus]VFT89296.1 Aste57867_12445 [Aphanomyces stellatus]